jgi:hypothetical protein
VDHSRCLQLWLVDVRSSRAPSPGVPAPNICHYRAEDVYSSQQGYLYSEATKRHGLERLFSIYLRLIYPPSSPSSHSNPTPSHNRQIKLQHFQLLLLSYVRIYLRVPLHPSVVPFHIHSSFPSPHFIFPPSITTSLLVLIKSLHYNKPPTTPKQINKRKRNEEKTRQSPARSHETLVLTTTNDRAKR